MLGDGANRPSIEGSSRLLKKILTIHTPSASPHRMPDPTAENGEAPQTNDSLLADVKHLPAFLKLSRNEIQAKFIDLEWQQRHRLAQGRQADTVSQWALLSGDDIASRNRYANIEVFANNRVKLKVPDGHSDYINASPIKLRSTKSGTEKSFIATQGPKEGIHGHIWRMIWQECADPAVIIMLTQTHESGREKCFQYFPADMENPTMAITEDDEFDDDFKAMLSLLNIVEDSDTQSTIREMELKTEGGEAKTIWHLLFSGWPDFSIPEDESRDALVRLIQLSAEKNTQAESPRVVHCSAGVGRSGTFIALDWLLTELEEGSLDDLRDGADPVTDIVDELRQQRMMMVQSDSQYNFLYDLMRQLWKGRQEGRKPSAVDPEKQGRGDARDVLGKEVEKEMQGQAVQSVFPASTD
jgi:protein-tyrosine phosphatase